VAALSYFVLVFVGFDTNGGVLGYPRSDRKYSVRSRLFTKPWVEDLPPLRRNGRLPENRVRFKSGPVFSTGSSRPVGESLRIPTSAASQLVLYAQVVFRKGRVRSPTVPGWE